MKTNSKEFKELNDEWREKLKSSGFDDVESAYGRLKTGANNNIENLHTTVSFELKQEYYRQVGFFLYDHEFKTRFDRDVWELHCEGAGVREIVKIFATRDIKTHKDKVDKTIQALRKLMLKKYRETYDTE